MLRESLFLFLGSASAFCADPPVPKPAPPEAVAMVPLAESAWRVSVGAQWRQIGSVDWDTGSAAAGWSLPWMAGRGHNRGVRVPAGAGDHTYDDGYVKTDINGATGDTWYWGYDKSSQVQGTDIVFHSADGGGSAFRTGSSPSVRDAGWSDDLAGAGLFAKIETPELLRWSRLSASLEFGYSWAHDDTSHVTRDVFHAEQRSIATSFALEDRYDASGIAIPPAPHAGGFAGPGPILPGAPTSRRLTGTDTSETAIFSSDVRESLEMNLHTLSLGPRFSAQCCERVRLGLGLGLAINIADWEAGFDESLTVRRNGGKAQLLKRWQAQASGTEVLPGFYVEVAAQTRITERVVLYVAGRYDWSEGFAADVGPSRLEFDPGGWSILLGVTLEL